MEISEKLLDILAVLLNDPSLLVYLVAMVVVAYALFVVHQAIKAAHKEHQ